MVLPRAQRLFSELIAQTQALMSENERLGYEVAKLEQQIRRLRAPQTGAGATPSPAVSSNGSNGFPVGGSLFDPERQPAPPPVNAGEAHAVTGAGMAGFDIPPPRPTGPVLEGFWQVPASVLIVQVYSIGGSYQGKVAAVGHTPFHDGQII